MTTKVRFEPMGIEVEQPEIGTARQLAEALVEGQAAIEELALLKPTLALAISRLPKKQIKLTLSDQANLGKLALQIKGESNGSILLRAVEVNGL